MAFFSRALSSTSLSLASRADFGRKYCVFTVGFALGGAAGGLQKGPPEALLGPLSGLFFGSFPSSAVLPVFACRAAALGRLLGPPWVVLGPSWARLELFFGRLFVSLPL